MVLCKCLFLDGKEIDITVSKDATGSDLFDSVCKYLCLQDRRPFGLVHRGGDKPSLYNWWVRMDKPLRKQITGKCQVWAFALIIKFYPHKNIEHCEDMTRFFSVLQVRNDLLTRRLTCSTNTLAILASYWVQSEYGDYTNDSIDKQLTEAFRFVKGDKQGKKGKQREDSDVDFEKQMIELHKYLKGTQAITADTKFLQLASSLPMYGTHFYPAFELPSSNSSLFVSRVQECGDAVTIGLAQNGVIVHNDKNEKSEPKIYSWNTIQAIAFKYNAVSLKMYPRAKEKESLHFSFAFEDINQAKIVWRTAIDLHVYYRVTTKDQPPQSVTVKLKRKWSILGKKQAKPVPAFAAAVVKRPQLSTIAENSPALRKSRTSLYRGDETTPKELEAKGTKAPLQNLHVLPLKTPKSPSTKSNLTHTTNSPSINRKTSRNGSPKSVTRKNANYVRSRSPSPGYVSTSKSSPSMSAYRDGKVASSVPARLKSGNTTSQTSTTGEEVLSEISDNTDVLCSKSIIEKAFSYAEEDGIQSINSWLELCSPRNNERGRQVSRSAPPSQRSRSRGRSPPPPPRIVDIDDIDDYKPLIKSKRPVVIKAKDLRDLSPPLTVHYEDEPVRRKPQRYKSADNVAHKDWTVQRNPIYGFDPAARRFAEIYRKEYLDNVVDFPDSYRRARSMYSLAPRNAIRERSTSSDYKRSVSPSTVSAHASSDSRKSFDSYLDASYDDDRFRRACDLPLESSFARRVYSESRLAKSNQSPEREREYVRRYDAASKQRRRYVTSWAVGDPDHQY